MNCIHCGAAILNQQVQCQICALPVNYEKTNPVSSLFKNRAFRQERIYPLFSLSGLILLLLYFMLFDDIFYLLPAGVFSLILGIFGYIAERMVSIAGQTINGTMRAAYKIWIHDLADANLFFALIAWVIIFPLYFFDTLRPIFVSFTSSIFWTSIYMLFWYWIYS